MVKKTKLIAFSFVISIALLTFISAGDPFKYHPRIDIKANDGEAYMLRFSDAITAQPLKSLLFEFGATGRENDQLETNSEMVNAILLKIKNSSLRPVMSEGNIEDEKNLGTFSTTEIIYIDTVSGRNNALTFADETDETEEEPEETTNTTQETQATEETTEPEEIVEEELTEVESSGITGQAIKDAIFSKSALIYSVIGFVIISGVVLFFVMSRHKGTSVYKEPNTVKLSEMKRASNQGRLDSAEARLKKAEEELIDAKNELNQMKNKKSEITQAEEEFRKAKEHLENLKNNQEGQNQQ